MSSHPPLRISHVSIEYKGHYTDGYVLVQNTLNYLCKVFNCSMLICFFKDIISIICSCKRVWFPYVIIWLIDWLIVRCLSRIGNISALLRRVNIWDKMTTSWAFRNEVLENSNTRCILPVKSRCNRGSKTAASLGDGKILNVTSDATDVCFAKWIWFPLNQPIKSWKQVHAYFESHGYISYIIV